MAANYTFNNFRFDRSERDDGLSFGSSSRNTTAFSMTPMLSFTPTISFQPPQQTLTGNSSPQTSTIMTPKLLNAIDVVNSHAQAGPSPILNPNLSVVPTAKNPDQLVKDAKNVLTAVNTIRAAQNNGGGQQAQQPVPVTTTVMPSPGVSTSFIGQGTFSPVKTSSSTPVYTSSRTAKTDVSAYSVSTTPTVDFQTGTTTALGGAKVNANNDLLGRSRIAGMSLTDPDTKGTVVAGGDSLKKVVKDASLTLASATQANRMAELKPSPDFVAKYSMNGGMSLPKPGAVG